MEGERNGANDAFIWRTLLRFARSPVRIAHGSEGETRVTRELHAACILLLQFLLSVFVVVRFRADRVASRSHYLVREAAAMRILRSRHTRPAHEEL